MSHTDPPPAEWSNAFWGLHDEGYEVVLARLRSSTKTVDALQSFWHERIAIEEDYARRLSKLGRSQGALLGKDEDGQLKEALETLGRETDGLGESHRNLAAEMKATLEAPNADFAARLTTFRKTNQTALEKIYKLKLSQEGYVNKARDKLSQQMLLSNSYTAQSSLSQGRELDRVASKLDRAQGNVAAAERDLRNFLGALAETWARWVDGWQVFCDEAQDLEEERVDFLKDVCWAYANSVSSVCVVDDEACERMRVALETVDAFAESAGFVRAHATSSQIPDPPRFVNYSAGEREPDAVAFREARFVRRSQRPAPVGVSEGVGPAAVDEQARRAEEDLAPRRSEEEVGEVQRAMEGMGLVQAPQTNGRAPAFAAAAAAPAPAPPAPVAAPQQQYEIPPPPAPAPAPVPVALLQQQQRQQQAPPPQLPQSIMSPSPHPSQIPPPPSSWTQPSHAAPPAPTASPAAAPATAAAAAAPVEDPIAKALADLQAKRMSRQGSFRSTASRASRHSQAIPASPRESVLSPAMYQSLGGQFAGGQQQASPSLVPPQGGSTAASLAHSQADFDARSNGGHGASSSVASRNDPRRRSVDYSQAGESIVGQHPSSRPNSPAPSSARAPSPAFMQAPVQPPSALPVEQVLDNYHQSFPGEQRENRARRNSAASDAASAYRQSMAVPSSASQAGHGDRSPSREGFAGVGTSMARAASPSPSFGGQQQQQQPNRAPSPSPSFIPQQQGYPGRAPSPSPSFGQQGGFQQSLHQPPARGASPAPSQMSRRSVGIALGSNGAVDRDEMADAYRSPSAPPPAPAPAPAPPAAPQQQQPAPVMSPQTLYSPYAGQPPAGVAGQQPGPPHQAAYGGYPAYGYAPPPPQTQAYPGYGQQYGGYAPPPAAAAGAPPMQAQGSQQGHAGRSGSVVSHQSAHSYQQQQQQQPPQQPQQQQQQAPQQMQPPPQAQQQGPPSPQTPGAYDQHTDAGQPVIFYVKALYDYTATIPEEFDFQSGDIIAVTATPDDGWWSGELLDETRRRPGQNTFPSNFVTMF